MNPTHAESEAEYPGILGWITTVDHKRIGILYLLTTLVFFLIGGVEALLIRVQLATPNSAFLSPGAYNQIFTMHGTTMVFLVVMPTLIGFANYFVPLMIGARDMALPRLNAFSYWLLLFGGLLLHFSFIAGGAPAAGWFSYAPLSGSPFSTSSGVDYWALSLLVLGIGSVASAINLIVTVLTLRAPGMTLRRVPLFVWMTFVNSILIILALPVLNAALVSLLIDRQLDARLFLPQGGGSAILWQHYFWAFGHPEVYIMVLPAFGMISEIIPVFSRKPIFGFDFVAASTVAIMLLSLGVWAHHMFAVGLGRPIDVFFAVGSMLIAIPTGVKIFNWIATLWGGTLKFTTSMLFAMAFLVEFTIGGLSGITFATVPIDWQVTDSYYLVAHMHYVLFGGTALAVMAAIYYWFPKMTGRMLSEPLGKAHFWITFVGFNLAFFVQHFLGLLGMRRRVYTYTDLPHYTSLNLLSTIGAFIIALSVVVLIANIVLTLRKGKLAGDNPWNAWTLEWATSSPPPHDNFICVPPINSRRPLWDLAHPDQPDDAHGFRLDVGEEEVVDKNKAAMWSFIVSEAGFFMVLIISYLAFNLGPAQQSAAKVLDPMKTALFTVCLIASSFTIMRAETWRHRGNLSAMRAWLVATISLGAVFIGGQGAEYYHLLTHGVSVSSSLFATTFFTLTGFHGLHVCVGLVALLVVLGLACFRDFTKTSAPSLEPISLYWHFVDGVWIVVFSIIYLRPLL
ncbi:MAG: cytochrome c oxidase subunit I [Verrucomicrobiota bacterium]